MKDVLTIQSRKMLYEAYAELETAMNSLLDILLNPVSIDADEMEKLLMGMKTMNDVRDRIVTVLVFGPDDKSNNILARLMTYPGPHSGEEWKLERNLAKCTDREKEEMKKLGLSVERPMALGLNRGQVHHILFGWKHS